MTNFLTEGYVSITHNEEIEQINDFAGVWNIKNYKVKNTNIDNSFKQVKELVTRGSSKINDWIIIFILIIKITLVIIFVILVIGMVLFCYTNCKTKQRFHNIDRGHLRREKRNLIQMKPLTDSSDVSLIRK